MEDGDVASRRGGAGAAWLDLTGALLFAAAILWTAVVGSARGGNALPTVLLILSVGFTIAFARMIGAVHRWLVPSVVVAVAAGLAISSRDLLSGDPLSGPFSYANATGAFFVLVAFAATMVAVVSRDGARMVASSAAVLAGLVPFAIGSMAAAAVLFLIPVGLLGLSGRGGVRIAIAVSAALVGAALLGTMWIGGTYRPSGASGPVTSLTLEVLTERRAVLWSEAWEIIRDDPLTGVGPGRFQFESTTARADRDALWAHHGFLQVGAETGVPGLLLLIAFFGWGFARLWATTDPDALVALGATALAALGILASVDYTLHFPLIPATTAALLGTASISRPKDRHDHRRDPA